MRRLTPLLAALVLLAGPLASAGHAVAGEDRREARREQGGGPRQARGRVFGGGRQEQGGQGRQPYRPQEYRPQQEYRQPPQEYRPQEYRGEPGGDPRYSYRGEPQYAPQRADPRYDPRAYAAPPNAYSAAPNSAPRRGGYMGQGGAVINDYDRYRLRPPPPGYDWVQTQRGAALVSRSTHQVFDVVPY